MTLSLPGRRVECVPVCFRAGTRVMLGRARVDGGRFDGRTDRGCGKGMDER